jgi:hypothetical protein
LSYTLFSPASSAKIGMARNQTFMWITSPEEGLYKFEDVDIFIILGRSIDK